MTANLHLAHISDVLLTWAVFAYAFAMFGYAAEFAAGRRAEARGGGAEAVKQGTRRAELVGRGGDESPRLSPWSALAPLQSAAALAACPRLKSSQLRRRHWGLA